MPIAIVIRHLPNHRPAILAVIKPDSFADSIDANLRHKADQAIEDFKRQYVEFRDANFYTDVIEDSQII